MKEIEIADNYMDEREFRNYVNTMFYKHGYHPLKIDDVRIADPDKNNNNDQLVTKDEIKYTVQTYLNEQIGEKEIKDTIEDMKKEKVEYGLIISNLFVNNEVKEKAEESNITILDRNEFKDDIYEKVE